MTKEQKQSAKDAIICLESRHNCCDLQYKVVNIRSSTKSNLIIADVKEYEDGQLRHVWRTQGYTVDKLKKFGYRG